MDILANWLCRENVTTIQHQLNLPAKTSLVRIKDQFNCSHPHWHWISTFVASNQLKLGVTMYCVPNILTTFHQQIYREISLENKMESKCSWEKQFPTTTWTPLFRKDTKPYNILSPNSIPIIQKITVLSKGIERYKKVSCKIRWAERFDDFAHTCNKIVEIGLKLCQAFVFHPEVPQPP